MSAAEFVNDAAVVAGPQVDLDRLPETYAERA